MRAGRWGFAENMDALKTQLPAARLFNGRGYFDLAQLSPADCRQGALARVAILVWSASGFDPMPCGSPKLSYAEREQLTDAGKAGVDSAIAPYLEYLASGIVMVEGYAQHGPRERAVPAIARTCIDRA